MLAKNDYLKDPETMHLGVGQHNGVNAILAVDLCPARFWDDEVAAVDEMPGALMHFICSPVVQHQKRIVLSSELLQSIRLESGLLKFWWKACIQVSSFRVPVARDGNQCRQLMLSSWFFSLWTIFICSFLMSNMTIVPCLYLEIYNY